MVGTSTEGVIEIADVDQHIFLIKGGGKVI